MVLYGTNIATKTSYEPMPQAALTATHVQLFNKSEQGFFHNQAQPN